MGSGVSSLLNKYDLRYGELDKGKDEKFVRSFIIASIVVGLILGGVFSITIAAIHKNLLEEIPFHWGSSGSHSGSGSTPPA